MPSSSNSAHENLGSYLAASVAVFWIATGAVLSTRFHLVLFYETRATVSPALEIFAVSQSAFLVLAITGLFFPILVRYSTQEGPWKFGLGCGLAATLPLFLVFLRCVIDAVPQPQIWEAVWFSVFTGFAFGSLSRSCVLPVQISKEYWHALLGLSTVGAFGWWLFQSHSYYQDYRLGFNDFGHFSQRIANTASGRGFLLETLVLPIFWDHFNPGLALLAPVWAVWPSVYMVFAAQALCLVLPAILLASIVTKLGGSPSVATMWGIGWLMHPSIGQMNLAYTYGWHPITVAIPLLLLSYRLLLSSRFVLSSFSTLVACSFEEGVIVVVGCFAAAMFLRAWTAARAKKHSNDLLTMRSWFVLFLVATVSFGLVYYFSGLAKFQTGRFAKLGGTAFEIIASPIRKPAEFWGLLFRPRNAAFLGLLAAPFLAAGLVRCRWHLLAIAMPLGVLVVWEHLPAQSIAFQYASCLLPVLFVGCIEGSLKTGDRQTSSERNLAAACLTTGWVLCLFVGQMPWSQSTMIELLGINYDLPKGESRRLGSEDHRWLTEQVKAVRSKVLDATSDSKRSPRVLATGRIASHMVGLQDIETVGQYRQRERDLAKIEPSLASPILRYDVIMLDFRERFQQTEEESTRVQEEALKNGFRVEQNRFGIAVLVRPK